MVNVVSTLYQHGVWTPMDAECIWVTISVSQHSCNTAALPPNLV